jgi:hypothetical protein
MSDREVDLARQEAKRRKRVGQAKSYTAALAQLAAENGHDDWTSYAKALAAVPGRAPDFRVRLVGAGGEERTFTLSLARVLAFHDLDQASWELMPPAARLQHVLECGLSSRRERGDTVHYTATLLESNVPSVVVPGFAKPGRAPAVAGANAGPADFVVELESRADGQKEQVGVQLVDVLEFHGIALADWESSGREEQESLVEEVALWSKRGAGDLGSYFSQVVSGFDGEEEGAESPR